MGTRFVPEHKPSLKKGPRGAVVSQTESPAFENVIEKVETVVVTAPKPAEAEHVVEKSPVVVTKTPAVQEELVEVATEVKTAPEVAKDIRKKKP